MTIREEYDGNKFTYDTESGAGMLVLLTAGSSLEIELEDASVLLKMLKAIMTTLSIGSESAVATAKGIVRFYKDDDERFAVRRGDSCPCYLQDVQWLLSCLGATSSECAN